MALSDTEDVFPAFVNQYVLFKRNLFKERNKIKTFSSPPQQSLKHRNVFKTAFHPCVQTKTYDQFEHLSSSPPAKVVKYFGI